MLASARRGIIYPNTTRSDSADVPRDFSSMVTALELDVVYGQGLLAARPTSSAGSPGLQGRVYWATDVNGGTLYWDFGTGWTAVGTSPTNTSIAVAILLSGVLSARPAAAAGNAGFYYFATDTNGGTLYQSSGSTWSTIFQTLASTNAQTASYTLVLTDGQKIIEMNVAGSNVLTVPPNSSVAFPVGTIITVIQTGAGITTITPGAAVTVNGNPGLKTSGQWAVAQLIKRGTDTWVALGNLTA